jgi:DNA-binding SARP family transcriptional activator
MTGLRLLLLGPPAVYRGEDPVQIQRRIQRALLFYLAAEAGPKSRAELTTLFWPEESDDLARRHLREALSKLRTQLAAALPGEEVLVAGQDRVELDERFVYVDTREFQKILDQVGHATWQLSPNKPLPEAVYQRLLKAVRLWRSPRFMAGANLPSSGELDDWLTRLSQNLEHTRERVLERLAAHARAVGDLEAALHWLRMALETDALNENLHYRVLEALISLGRRTEAIKHYRSLQELLQRELGAAPSAALQALVQKVGQEDAIQPPSDRPGWPVSMSMQVPFVGREQTLRDLGQAFHRGGMVALFGEAGAGKTRLVQELFCMLEPAPHLLLAPSRPLENNLPFQPLIELLRHSIAPADWSAIPPVWASHLSVLLPELHVLHPGLPAPPQLDPEQARALLFEAFHQLLLTLAAGPSAGGAAGRPAARPPARQPILLFLDDAQWADEATLAAMGFLVERSFFDRDSLLLIAARPEEVNPALARLLHSPHIATAFRRVDLELLGEEEIAHLVRNALGQTPSDRLVKRLAQDTGGNPLFLLETLRGVLEQPLGPDLANVPDTLPLAPSIHTLVRTRVRSLTPTAHQTLLTAAVLGNTFTLPVLEKACRLGAEQVVQALEELEQTHLVQPFQISSPGEPAYQFIHDKIREVLVLELSPARKRLLHLRAAQAMEQALGVQAAQQAPVLARHFEAGGQPIAAFHYWIQAAQRARQLYSASEAQAAYHTAERLLPPLGPHLTDADYCLLYAGWGELAFEARDRPTLDRVYTALLRVGEERQSQGLIGCALSGLGNVATLHNQPAEALLYVEQAVGYLKGALEAAQANAQANAQDKASARGESAASGGAFGGGASQMRMIRFEYMQALIRRGSYLGMLNRYEEANEAYQTALELGKDSPGVPHDPRVAQARSEALSLTSLGLARLGWPAKGLEQGKRALQQAVHSQQLPMQVHACEALAWNSTLTGDFDQAYRYIHKGFELAESMAPALAPGPAPGPGSDPGSRANLPGAARPPLGALHVIAAHGKLINGELDRVWAHLDYPLDSGPRLSSLEWSSQAYALRGETYRLLECYPQAIESFQKGITGSPDSFETLENLYRLGLALGQSGNLDQGLRCIEQAGQHARQAGLGTIELAGRLAQAFLLHCAGEPESAGQLAGKVQAEADQRCLVFVSTAAGLLKAGTCLAAGRPEEAAALVQGGIEQARSLRHVWLEMDGLDLAWRAARRSGGEAPAARTRLEELLDGLVSAAVHPDLRPQVAAYRQKRLAQAI